MSWKEKIKKLALEYAGPFPSFEQLQANQILREQEQIQYHRMKAFDTGYTKGFQAALGLANSVLIPALREIGQLSTDDDHTFHMSVVATEVLEKWEKESKL